jgi:hypothetical protein
MENWRLDEWNARFAKDDQKLITMPQEEIQKAIQFLKDKWYPKPEDCPEKNCPNYRPSCKLNVCQIAVGMCGDF